MLADVRVVEQALDAHRGELVARTDAREQQQLRRADRPGAHHDLARGGEGRRTPLGVAVADAGGAQASAVGLEQDLLDQGVGDDRQVGPVERRLQERVVRRGALALARRGLEERRQAGGAAAVATVVVTRRDAGGRGGLDELLRRDRARRAHRDAQRTAGAVGLLVDDHALRRVGRREVLALGEVGQHVVVGPALAAGLGPGVEVAGVPAHVGHVVEAGRAAEHLAARHHHPAVDDPLAGAAGVAGVHPVDVGVVLERGDRRRHQRVRAAADPRPPPAPPSPTGPRSAGPRSRRPPTLPPPRSRRSGRLRRCLLDSRSRTWTISLALASHCHGRRC